MKILVLIQENKVIAVCQEDGLSEVKTALGKDFESSSKSIIDLDKLTVQEFESDEINNDIYFDTMTDLLLLLQERNKVIETMAETIRDAKLVLPDKNKWIKPYLIKESS